MLRNVEERSDYECCTLCKVTDQRKETVRRKLIHAEDG
jgi:hypothetical protein